MNSIQQSFKENYGMENNIRKKFLLWHSTIIDIPPTPTKNETDDKQFHGKSEKAIAEKNYNSKNSSNDAVNKNENDFDAEEAGWVSIEVSDIITKSTHDNVINDNYDNDKYVNYDNYGKSRDDTIEYDDSNEDWEIIHNVRYLKPKMISKMGK